MNNETKTLVCAVIASLTCSSVDAALTVVDNPGLNAGPTTPLALVVSSPFPGITLYQIDATDPSNGAFIGTISGAGNDFQRAGTDTLGLNFIDSTANLSFSIDNMGQSFNENAIAGTDNWLYFSRNGNPDPSFHKASSWVQFEITTTSFTVLRYVHDPVNPTADFSLQQAIDAVNAPEPSAASLLGLGFISMLIRRKR